MRNRYYDAWQKYEEEAKEAKFHAEVAKQNYRKSDYEFWLVMYKEATKNAERMHLGFINALT